MLSGVRCFDSYRLSVISLLAARAARLGVLSIEDVCLFAVGCKLLFVVVGALGSSSGEGGIYATGITPEVILRLVDYIEYLSEGNKFF